MENSKSTTASVAANKANGVVSSAPVQAAKIGEKDELAEGLLAPDTIVRGFRILRVMRFGQSNNVYVGLSPKGQEVAIKEYFPRRLGRRMASGRIGVMNEKTRSQFESGVKGFVAEAIALAEIQSNLLAPYVAAFRENGTAYLITVMVPGDTLEGYARKIIKAKVPGSEFPSEGDLRLIFWSLLHAVQVMHDCGFLHLDIKPSNVIMSDEFTPILIDLGGARRFPYDPGKHTVSVSNYTPGFAAPEQHQERSAEFCPATDIYGIGASILYCMTGRVPPQGAERLKEDKIDELLKRCETNRYSRQMISIVKKCMEVRIEDRYENVKEVQAIIASQ